MVVRAGALGTPLGGPRWGLRTGPRPASADDAWLQDSIILGRLAALANRYRAAKLTAHVLGGWKRLLARRQQKQWLALQMRALLALRAWRRSAVRRGPGRRWLAAAHAVHVLCRGALRQALRAWTRQVHGLRNLHRGYRLLLLVQARERDQLARALQVRRRLRAAFAALAADCPGRPRPVRAAPEERVRSTTLVFRRALRRWFYAALAPPEDLAGSPPTSPLVRMDSVESRASRASSSPSPASPHSELYVPSAGEAVEAADLIIPVDRRPGRVSAAARLARQATASPRDATATSKASRASRASIGPVVVLGPAD